MVPAGGERLGCAFPGGAGLGLRGLLPGLVLVVAAIGLIRPNSASPALSAHPLLADDAMAGDNGQR